MIHCKSVFLKTFLGGCWSFFLGGGGGVFFKNSCHVDLICYINFNLKISNFQNVMKYEIIFLQK